MTRIEPREAVRDAPCSIAAIDVAYNVGFFGKLQAEDMLSEILRFQETLRKNGYCSLKQANAFFRKTFDVQRYTYFKRADRISLKEYSENFSDRQRKELICVKGHFIYADFERDEYWSFFDNLNDEVVAVWRLK